MRNAYSLALILILASLFATGQTKTKSTLEIEYSYTRNKLDTALYNVEAKIINPTNDPVYFLSESCNGLDYYLSAAGFNVNITHHCNATFPVKNVLKPGSEFVFKTTLKEKSKGAEIDLQLKLFLLDPAATVKNKNVGQVQKEPGTRAITLKSVQKRG